MFLNVISLCNVSVCSRKILKYFISNREQKCPLTWDHSYFISGKSSDSYKNTVRLSPASQLFDFITAQSGPACIKVINATVNKRLYCRLQYAVLCGAKLHWAKLRGVSNICPNIHSSTHAKTGGHSFMFSWPTSLQGGLPRCCMATQVHTNTHLRGQGYTQSVCWHCVAPPGHRPAESNS